MPIHSLYGLFFLDVCKQSLNVISNIIEKRYSPYDIARRSSSHVRTTPSSSQPIACTSSLIRVPLPMEAFIHSSLQEYWAMHSHVIRMEHTGSAPKI